MFELFKITCFAPVEPIQLEQSLRGLHFKKVKNGFEWHVDGTTFRIEPFQNQPRESNKGYRVFFNGSIEGGCYLFDLSLGLMGAFVTGVEYILEQPSKTNEDWIKDLRKRPSYQMVDPRGLFTKKGCGIIVVNQTVTIQVRSRKNQKLKMLDCMKQVDCIREELMPVNFDLFSFLGQEEEIA